jgi:hypothetical protein
MKTIAASPVLIVSVLAALAIGAAEVAAGGSAVSVVSGFLIPIGYGMAVTVTARRSETASVLSGRPIDERWEHLNIVASTWAFGLSAVIVLAAFVGVRASRGDALPYAFVAGVMAMAYVSSLVLLRFRG